MHRNRAEIADDQRYSGVKQVKVVVIHAELLGEAQSLQDLRRAASKTATVGGVCHPDVAARADPTARHQQFLGQPGMDDRGQGMKPVDQDDASVLAGLAALADRELDHRPIAKPTLAHRFGEHADGVPVMQIALVLIVILGQVVRRRRRCEVGEFRGLAQSFHRASVGSGRQRPEYEWFGERMALPSAREVGGSVVIVLFPRLAAEKKCDPLRGVRHAGALLESVNWPLSWVFVVATAVGEGAALASVTGD